MFNLKEFQNNTVLKPIVEKLNKLLSKEKTQKIIKIIEELEGLLVQSNNRIPITYILSILAEHNSELISEGLIQKIEPFIHSEDEKLRINSFIVIGFAVITKPNLSKKFFYLIAELLLDNSEDIRDNAHYFLMELMKKNPDLVNSISNIIIKSLSIEKKKENIISLLNLLEYCSSLNFEELFNFREVSKSLLLSYRDDQKSKINTILIKLLKKFFPRLKELNLETREIDNLVTILDEQFLMKKHNFTELSRNENITLKGYLKSIKKSRFKEQKIFFYVKTKKDIILIYELEKVKLISFFDKDTRISNEEIKGKFSQIIKNESELKSFLQTLIKLKIIEGYFSDLGFYYSFNHIKTNLISELKQNGMINLKKYKHLPPDFIRDIIIDIRKSQKDKLLQGKAGKAFYSLKNIQERVNSEAAKNSVIDLKSFRGRLTEEDFINLIKNLPREYLSNYHKGTQWLTNLGTLRTSNEIQRSKILGFFDIDKISKKLNIGQMLLIDVLDQLVDNRSGIWDKNREVFYYSKYLKEKIYELSLLTDEGEKSKKIEGLAKELNIEKNLITTKIDENLQLIGDEIKKKDQIEISEYLEKTGMELDIFIKFIDDLGINYLKKADSLIFKPSKIDEAKSSIKFLLIDKSKSVDNISFGNFDITSNLIEDLIKDLLDDGKLKGVFHEIEGEIVFYTERGIRSLMMENSFLFSFNDLFYGKELSIDEINLLNQIFDDLIKHKRLKGTFDEESLTFSSNEVLFAKDYNTVLFEFEKKVNSYIKIFDSEFQKIKKILIKKNETIFPQEIKMIQEIIDKINIKYVGWRSGLETYVRSANKKLLKDQGFTVKKYKDLFSTEKVGEIKSFEKDPEVYDQLNNFNKWVKVFNRLELKYANVIFYQKRLINNPDDVESKRVITELLNELFLT
ncbi:MAG: hypothetical protein ACXACO_00810 [Promethearchaeota archaeon]|jgi:hypothetical protein